MAGRSKYRKVQDFLANSVEAEGGCRVWQGVVRANGYGLLSGRHVHRRLFQVAHGPIPEGMVVDHICFNPTCINLSHLRLLSHPENCSRTRESLKRACVSGHPYDDENTYRYVSKQGHRRRFCRACHRASEQQRYRAFAGERAS